MYPRSVQMACGHYADGIMDVMYNHERIDVAACSACFDLYSTVNQPACSVIDTKPLPAVEHDLTVVGYVAAVMGIIALVVTLWM